MHPRLLMTPWLLLSLSVFSLLQERTWAQDGILSSSSKFKDTIAESVARRDIFRSWKYYYKYREFNLVAPKDRTDTKLTDGSQYSAKNDSALTDLWGDENKRMTEISGMVFSSNDAGLHVHVSVLVSKGERFRSDEFPCFAALQRQDGLKFRLLDRIAAERDKLELLPTAIRAVSPELAFKADFYSVNTSKTGVASIPARDLSPIDFRAAGLMLLGDFMRHLTLEKIGSNYMSWGENGVTVCKNGSLMTLDHGQLVITFDESKDMWPVKLTYSDAQVLDGKVKFTPKVWSEVTVKELGGVFVPETYTISDGAVSRRLDYEWISINEPADLVDADLQTFAEAIGKPIR